MKWIRTIRSFSDQLTRAMRLADNSQAPVDAHFNEFAAGLNDADPATYDPVQVVATVTSS